MSNNTRIELEEALQARTALMTEMTGAYDPTHIETFQALQKRVGELEEALKADQAPSGATCTVTLIRGGKTDKTVEVRADGTLGMLMDALGWESEGLNFRLRTGQGQTEVIGDPSAHVFGTSEQEIFVTHKVAAG